MLDARNFWRNPSGAGPLFSRNVHVVLKGAPGNGGSACRVRSAAGIRTSASGAGNGTASTKSAMLKRLPVLNRERKRVEEKASTNKHA
jgi:hypothetical protein